MSNDTIIEISEFANDERMGHVPYSNRAVWTWADNQEEIVQNYESRVSVKPNFADGSLTLDFIDYPAKQGADVYDFNTRYCEWYFDPTVGILRIKGTKGVRGAYTFTASFNPDKTLFSSF